MCYFLLLGNKKPDAAWVLMGIIVKVSQSVRESRAHPHFPSLILLTWLPFILSDWTP
jgi:hypothetical protein